jgi:hypothetical protein
VPVPIFIHCRTLRHGVGARFHRAQQAAWKEGDFMNQAIHSRRIPRLSARGQTPELRNSLRRTLALLFALALAVLPITTHPVLAQSEEISVFVDGKHVVFDTPPIVIRGRTLVPLRAIFEAMGADVTWIAREQLAQAVKGDTTVEGGGRVVVSLGDSRSTPSRFTWTPPMTTSHSTNPVNCP